MEDQTIQARRQNPLAADVTPLGRRPLPIKEKTAPLAFFFLCLYSIAVLIRPHEFSLSTANFIIIKVFAILSFGFTLITLRPIKLQPQHYLLLGLVPLIMMSAFLNGWGTGGIFQAQRLFVSSIIPFFLYSALIATPGRQRLLMYICIAAALVMVYNGHIQQASFNGKYGIGIGDSITVGRDEMRITYLGFFSDPNDLGMFLVMNMPFVAYFFGRGGAVVKIAMLAILVAFGYGVYMTGSRGTLLGSVAVIGLYFLISNAGARLILFACLSAPIAATLLASFGGLSSTESSAAGRLDAWYDGIQMLIHNPVFGVGMGNFMDHHGKVAHNSYVHVAAELGVPGYSLWGGALILNMLVGYAILKRFNRYPNDDDPQDLEVSEEKSEQYKEEANLNKALFYSMIGFMVTAFFLSRQFTLLMFIFMGMQTASHLRLMKLRPDLEEMFSAKMVWRCMGYSWAVIVAVYMTLKVGL
ncbi:O-antigen ligase [Agarivorans sp. B2Z047]|uniref:O-antigen ligase family protein n=1 Tax=Agarivorans sp. B2Z047 TaxID=2652721 RepID=UPI001D15138C|nr:O-antigen ligase family protein [Agarivorans sp. B2Z047]UQN42393.1 O-antigen ligase family protein [Agarivorans sp. B2Z047]